MYLLSIQSFLTEETLKELIEQYRSYGPLPGILLTFMKSFIPPMPTMVIVGVNAAVYGFWLGFLYSWIGIVSGCMVTFLIVRRISGIPYLLRWAEKPRVSKSIRWVQSNAYSYVFLLSLFPVGPFVVINMAAAVARMRIRSFLMAIIFGKAIMVISVTYIGHDLSRFVQNPFEITYVIAFIGACLYISKRIERRFST